MCLVEAIWDKVIIAQAAQTATEAEGVVREGAVVACAPQIRTE
jgi:hypothetical protein